MFVTCSRSSFRSFPHLIGLCRAGAVVFALAAWCGCGKRLAATEWNGTEPEEYTRKTEMFNIDEYIACSDSCKSFVARSNSSRHTRHKCVYEKTEIRKRGEVKSEE